jgi:ferric-dicitrate binding protein FerR (iron transport regulator)
MTDDLLDRFLAGLCTPEEEILVRQWAASYPQGAQLLADVRQFWDKAGASAFAATPLAVDQGLAIVRRRIKEAKLEAQTPSAHPSTAHSPAGRPGVTFRRAAGGRTWPWIATTLCVALLAVGGTMVALRGNLFAHQHSEAQREYVTRYGERMTMELGDGTRVVLGANSRLRVPLSFPRGSRDVTLTGTGYFEIVHDPAHPFVVRAGETRVQALGTAFSVTRRTSDTATRVVVADGKVGAWSAAPHARRDAGHAAVLVPGDVLIFSPTGERVEHNADLTRELGWTRGELVFRRTSLANVARRLERWYGVSISIPDATLAERRVTATFTDEGIEQVMRSLTTAVGAAYHRDGRTIVITIPQ